MPKSKKTDQELARGFEELEAIAAWFEKGETDLDEGVKKFERAMTLAHTLKQQLVRTENKVQEIKKLHESA